MTESYRDESESAEEQREERTAGPGDPDVPEADAVEQATEVRPSPENGPKEIGDLPEADALEQAREVEEDDEDRR